MGVFTVRATYLYCFRGLPNTLIEKLSAEGLRMKKAGNDLEEIEESMRRMKEKGKGKARAVEKARKGRACASFCIRLSVRNVFSPAMT